MDNRAASIFGTVDFEVTDRLTLTAGFNYTDDHKSYALNMTAFDELANINFVDAVIVGQIAGALMIPPSQVTPTMIGQSQQANPGAFAAHAAAATTPERTSTRLN